MQRHSYLLLPHTPRSLKSRVHRGYVKVPLCKHIIPLDISFDFRD